MTGQDLATQARLPRPALKVLYMSGYAGDTMNSHDGPEDQTQLLQKPFRKEDLAREIRTALDAE